MALANPFHIANTLGKSITGPAPKPLPNPWHVANTQGQDITGVQPVYSQVPAVTAAPMIAPPPPPPPDFNALTLSDAQYTTGKQMLDQQNALTLEQMLSGYKRNSQSAQDNANAHGALFSGAAVNAQRSLGQDYANQQRQQALNLQQGQASLYRDVFNRLIQQLGGA